MRRKSFGEQMLGVAYLLILVCTAFALLLMPDLVGADWPGWTSSMVAFAILGLPVVALLTGMSVGSARVGRWIAVAVIALAAGRIVAGLFDAGSRAAFLAIAISPVLVLLVLAIALVAYSWPWATTRALADVAQARGWTAYRELPPDLVLPGTALPLPVGRRWVVRNVIRTPDGAAFEVRWLEWHGLLCRRRLAVFVGARLPKALPWLQVVPGRALTRSDLDLESAEFNRSFDVLGENSRYLMAMLQPRAMQLLLDARPLGLVVTGDALVAYDEQGLTPESLVRGVTAVQGFGALLPRHVVDEWGTHPQAAGSRLRFAMPERKVSTGLIVGRVLAMSFGLVALALAAALAAAAAESQARGIAFEPLYPVWSLLVAVLVLTGGAVGLGAATRA
ncbi:hypothetical protein [Kribbella sp. NPDC023855]|uniref:hypothetical protein n=1 Tax=Kribbella sp. NPDC023855 TaxID=3154698 RepID=UPI0033F07501